jgi:hypothetical protein
MSEFDGGFPGNPAADTSELQDRVRAFLHLVDHPEIHTEMCGVEEGKAGPEMSPGLLPDCSPVDPRWN